MVDFTYMECLGTDSFWLYFYFEVFLCLRNKCRLTRVGNVSNLNEGILFSNAMQMWPEGLRLDQIHPVQMAQCDIRLWVVNLELLSFSPFILYHFFTTKTILAIHRDIMGHSLWWIFFTTTVWDFPTWRLCFDWWPWPSRNQKFLRPKTVRKHLSPTLPVRCKMRFSKTGTVF